MRVLLNFKNRENEKQYRNFPILTSTYVLGAQKKRLYETVLLSIYNDC